MCKSVMKYYSIHFWLDEGQGLIVVIWREQSLCVPPVCVLQSLPIFSFSGQDCHFTFYAKHKLGANLKMTAEALELISSSVLFWDHVFQ